VCVCPSPLVSVLVPVLFMTVPLPVCVRSSVCLDLSFWVCFCSRVVCPSACPCLWLTTYLCVCECSFLVTVGAPLHACTYPFVCLGCTSVRVYMMLCVCERERERERDSTAFYLTNQFISQPLQTSMKTSSYVTNFVPLIVCQDFIIAELK
jgi:hypothetical protein